VAKRNQVLKEKWLLFGDWYIHPNFNKKGKYPSTHNTWLYWNLPQNLAHKCKDGKIGRVVGGGTHKSKRKGLWKIYGKCYYCQTPVGDKIHTLINMLEIL
jgi:hypothetical protein